MYEAKEGGKNGFRFFSGATAFKLAGETVAVLAPAGAPPLQPVADTRTSLVPRRTSAL